MFFVDRQKIEVTLVFLEKQIELFSHLEQWESPVEKAALERLAHTMIEAVLDAGNAIIDGFIMRDPGSYQDIIDILLDEKVVSDEMGRSLKQLISHRKQLVQSYTDINHILLEEDLRELVGHLSAFPQNIRDYLSNELGPVSAFRNE